jgi:hypothetical protein
MRYTLYVVYPYLCSKPFLSRAMKVLFDLRINKQCSLLIDTSQNENPPTIFNVDPPPYFFHRRGCGRRTCGGGGGEGRSVRQTKTLREQRTIKINRTLLYIDAADAMILASLQPRLWQGKFPWLPFPELQPVPYAYTVRCYRQEKATAVTTTVT